MELYTEPYASMYEKDQGSSDAPFVATAEEALRYGLGVRAGMI